MAIKDIKFATKPSYTNSRGLVIGIDEYLHAPNLSYAVSDAKAIKDLLISEFAFEKEKITFPKDKKATRASVLKAFAEFAKVHVELDDRIIVFFAGHGHTLPGVRGDQGFLVPYDGEASDISTLINWRELTGLADLIRAKHIFFIMDACYSGLVLTRGGQGPSRFVKDMMRRFSRQVLTAGKADEVVADSGGPLPHHSVFTGHLIEGLQGKASDDSGVMTANSLMAYVYRNVATDKNSNQTPHFGHFDGDGDLILKTPSVQTDSETNHDEDVLISITYSDAQVDLETLETKVALAKDFLSDESKAIKLHDFVIRELKKFVSQCSDDRFTPAVDFTLEELTNRISTYEELSKTMMALSSVISFWGRQSQLPILQKIFTRSLDSLLMAHTSSILTNLRWHPLFLVFYSSGIASVEARNYGALAAVLSATAPKIDPYSKNDIIAERLSSGYYRNVDSQTYKRLPGHDRYYAPMSEYLFKALQPSVDDLLFIGPTYEDTFDEFEILWAMVVQDAMTDKHKLYVHPPIGRFGWKHKNRDNSPLSRIIEQANDLGENWAPIKAGLFGGKPSRATSAAQALTENVAKRDYY